MKKQTCKIHTNKKKISCNGSAAKSPHPLVYLHLEKDKETICPYCSITYIYKK